MLAEKNKILYISVILLTILYILSFTKTCSSTDKREKIKTSLVNPKYSDSISEIELYNSESYIKLTKKNNNWILQEKNNKYSIPASNLKVENLIKDLINIRNMYKLSDKLSKNNSLGLTDSSTFHLKYYYEETFHELLFGSQDFSLSSRFLMTEKSTTIYEINDTFDKYLSASIQSWSEPYLISQQIIGKISAEDIQSAKLITKSGMTYINNTSKLLDLRHGGLPASSSDKIISELSEATIELELGNKNSITLEIFKPENENEYLVKTKYNYFKNSEIYYSKISSWTYNKIKEITL